MFDVIVHDLSNSLSMNRYSHPQVSPQVWLYEKISSINWSIKILFQGSFWRIALVRVTLNTYWYNYAFSILLSLFHINLLIWPKRTMYNAIIRIVSLQWDNLTLNMQGVTPMMASITLILYFYLWCKPGRLYYLRQ